MCVHTYVHGIQPSLPGSPAISPARGSPGAFPGRGLGRHPRPGALRGGHQALRAEARLRGGADAGHNRLRW